MYVWRPLSEAPPAVHLARCRREAPKAAQSGCVPPGWYIEDEDGAHVCRILVCPHGFKFRYFREQVLAPGLPSRVAVTPPVSVVE